MKEYQEQSQSQNKQITIESSQENPDVVSQSAEAFRQALISSGVSEELAGDLCVGFIEVVQNALKHGNKFNPDKKVEINYSISPDSVKLSVEDEGAGDFKLADVPDPLANENLAKTSGRGLLMMQHYFDTVEFQAWQAGKGTKVVMKKNLKETK